MRRLVALLVLVAAAAAGCADSTGSPDDILTSADLVANPESVLSASLVVDTPADATVDVRLESGDHTVTVPSSVDGPDHSIPLVGMRPETTYRVLVEATLGDRTDATVLEFTTGPLPEDFPPLELAVGDVDAMAPGVTLFNLISWGPPEGSGVEAEPLEHPGILLAVDEAGEVVWYYRTTLNITDAKMTQRGTVLVSVNDVVIREIDVLGNTVREFGTSVAVDHVREDVNGTAFATAATERLPIDSAHHEVTELANGNLLTLSTRLFALERAEAEALCPDAPEVDVVEDVVVEITPEGEVVGERPMRDFFDPIERPGAEMCVDGPPVAPPNWFYPQADLTRDWTHGNAVVIEEETNAVLVSLRHLDSTFAYRYEDDGDGPAGELLWDLSPGGTLDLDGDFSFHQHAVEPQGDGLYLLYDNGNGRPGTGFDEGLDPPYSRAVIYEIDAAAQTARQVWEHRDVTAEGRPVFTGFLGDADRQPNGNVLITHGGAQTADDVQYARLVEVTADLGADADAEEIVFDLTVGDQATWGWSVYRAERLPSLYG